MKEYRVIYVSGAEGLEIRLNRLALLNWRLAAAFTDYIIMERDRK